MGEARGCFAFFCTGKPENASRRGRIQGSIPIWQVGSLNGAETLAIALLEVMLCPKRDAPEFKASLLVGERFGERFSRSRPKVRSIWG